MLLSDVYHLTFAVCAMPDVVPMLIGYADWGLQSDGVVSKLGRQAREAFRSAFGQNWAAVEQAGQRWIEIMRQGRRLDQTELVSCGRHWRRHAVDSLRFRRPLHPRFSRSCRAGCPCRAHAWRPPLNHGSHAGRHRCRCAAGDGDRLHAVHRTDRPGCPGRWQAAALLSLPAGPSHPRRHRHRRRAETDERPVDRRQHP